jgi:hypothetical protein
MVFASDGGTRLNILSTHDEGGLQSLVQNPPITSDLATLSGELVVPGPRVFFVTADRSIEMRGLDREEAKIHGVRIPAAQPVDQPWRWSPLVLSADVSTGGERRTVFDSVVVSHPSGIVCRAELRITEEITHLFVTKCRTDLPPLASSPVKLRSQILCVGTDGRCMLLDPKTLRTVSDCQVAGPIRGVAVDSGLAYILLGRSGVQALDVDGDKLVPGPTRELGEGDWQVVLTKRGRLSDLLLFSSTGEIVKLDRATGGTVWSHRAPAPLALPPQWVGDELVLATTDGGLLFVPDPGAATRRIEN